MKRARHKGMWAHWGNWAGLGVCAGVASCMGPWREPPSPPPQPEASHVTAPFGGCLWSPVAKAWSCDLGEGYSGPVFDTAQAPQKGAGTDEEPVRIEAVYWAQHHVQKSTDPFFFLRAGRGVWVALAAVSSGGAKAPPLHIRLSAPEGGDVVWEKTLWPVDESRALPKHVATVQANGVPGESPPPLKDLYWAHLPPEALREGDWELQIALWHPEREKDAPNRQPFKAIHLEPLRVWPQKSYELRIVPVWVNGTAPRPPSAPQLQRLLGAFAPIGSWEVAVEAPLFCDVNDPLSGRVGPPQQWADPQSVLQTAQDAVRKKALSQSTSAHTVWIPWVTAPKGREGGLQEGVRLQPVAEGEWDSFGVRGLGWRLMAQWTFPFAPGPSHGAMAWAWDEGSFPGRVLLRDPQNFTNPFLGGGDGWPSAELIWNWAQAEWAVPSLRQMK